MLGKIDENGFLSIERAGVFKKQYCTRCGSYNSRIGDVVLSSCGDYCPLFNEVYEINMNNERTDFARLHCSRDLITFQIIDDARGSKE